MSQTLVIPREVAARLTKESCANCKFAHKEKDGDLACRRMPPTAFLIATPLPPPRVGMGFLIKAGHAVVAEAAQPGMAAERWCGEWKSKSGENFPNA